MEKLFRIHPKVGFFYVFPFPILLGWKDMESKMVDTPAGLKDQIFRILKGLP
jgi:hypothetical protein